MPDSIVLRRATLADSDCLLRWRNDPDTRANSRHTELISEPEHNRWLTASLANPDRQILMAIRNSQAPSNLENRVGTLRADNHQSYWLLSWTVAPECRGQGIAKKMVSVFTAECHGELRAEIRANNVASIQVAKFCGLELWQKVDDFLYFRRPGVETPAFDRH